MALLNYVQPNITFMKKPLLNLRRSLYGGLLIAGVLTTGALSAQITVGQFNVAGIGTVIPQSLDTLPTGINPGSASGTAQTWDFSGLNEHEIDTMVFANPSWTPNGADFPGANLAAVVESDDGDFYVYLDKNANGLSVVGQAADFFQTGTPVSIPVTPSEMILEFPATYNSTYSGTSGFDITLDGSSIDPNIDSVRLKQTRVESYIIDAFGDVTTPLGTYPSIRVNVSETVTDSSWILAFGMWTLADNSTEMGTTYDWWTDDPNVGFPLVTMEVDGGGNIQSVTYLKTLPAPTSVQELENGTNINVYPNPTSDFVNVVLDVELQGSIEIYNVNGQLIDSQQITQLNTTFDVSNQNNGVYLYILRGESGEMLSTGKFTVAR